MSRLAQTRQQQQNVEDAVKEIQKPLALIDDEDLDRMLREQEERGTPWPTSSRRRAAKENKNKKGVSLLGIIRDRGDVCEGESLE